MESTITLTQPTKHPSSHDLQRVRRVRFRHLFAQVRAIVHLFVDGQEKLSGAYIFDRHYIISLVDKIIDLSRKLVFDASILAPEGMRDCYADFDACKQEAENRFLKNEEMDEAETAVDQDSEVFEHTAEYRQLQRVLKWIGGHEAEEGVSIFDFLNGTLRHVFRTFEKPERLMQSDYRLTLSVNGHPIHIDYLDMDDGMRDLADRQVSWEDLACTPLVELLRGALRTPLEVQLQRVVPCGHWPAATRYPFFRYPLQHPSGWRSHHRWTSGRATCCSLPGSRGLIPIKYRPTSGRP
jgi:hypothetical protein